MADLSVDAKPIAPREETRNTEGLSKRNLPSTPLPPDFHFYALLEEISTEISTETLRKIKLLYKGELGTKMYRETGDPKDILIALYERGYIVPDSLIHLQKIVLKIDNENTQIQLMEKIYKYSNEHKAVHFRPPTECPPTDCRRIRFHIYGVDYYQYTNEELNKLKYVISSLTGADLSEILVDEIRQTNSIYITVLLKQEHFRILCAFLVKGIPHLELKELKIDRVTFQIDEQEKMETTIDASCGRPCQKQQPDKNCPEETIQKQRNIISNLQFKNAEYRQKVKIAGELFYKIKLLVSGENEVNEEASRILESIENIFKNPNEKLEHNCQNPDVKIENRRHIPGNDIPRQIDSNG